jgi:hypothetical protein
MENKINRDKVVFINLTEMDKYNGLEENTHGGGTYVDENGYGHELFNFSPDAEKNAMDTRQLARKK